MENNYIQNKTESFPQIYVYETPNNSDTKGYLKIGYTERDVQTRIKEQTHTANTKAKILWTAPAFRNDGTVFTDKDIHRRLDRKGMKNIDGTEWYECTLPEVKTAYNEIITGQNFTAIRENSFGLRNEQGECVRKTKEYFEAHSDKQPKFLWNCKMRFGKTFTAYELAKQMGLKRVLVLTFKPAVASQWRGDLDSHTDFEGWQFLYKQYAEDDTIDRQFEDADKNKPIVCFGSFQDFLRSDSDGNIKAKNQWVHQEPWDLVIFDEYHYGAWREKAKDLFNTNDDVLEDIELTKINSKGEEESNYDKDLALNETFLPITAKYYLYMSGTPFRALNQGEFIEDQIYTWTYADEQHAKEVWEGPNNPYESLPKMVMMTYQMPDDIVSIARKGENNEFDLNEFFATEKDVLGVPVFKHEDQVQMWLNAMRLQGEYKELGLKSGDSKPVMPFADARLLDYVQHCIWLMPGVDACKAMKSLLESRKNSFYHDWTVNLCAGTEAGIGAAALPPVEESMNQTGKGPLECKTITLTCGKLMTGVTVKPWSAIFMLCNLKSPETYFQSAFRVQSPWTIRKDSGEEEIIKPLCYVFDFSIHRALSLLSEYATQLNTDKYNKKQAVEDFIHFLPVIAYENGVMHSIDAAQILDLVATGMSSNMLARRWGSPKLVNVDNATLEKFLADEKALEIINKIIAYRNNSHFDSREAIETIIAKSDVVKKIKPKPDKTQKEKRELTEKEKEIKSLRKQIQEKLIKFIQRIPVFVYLTDNREEALAHVLENMEPSLFYQASGITVEDFKYLVSIKAFDDNLLDDCVYKFKLYEDKSLTYLGIDKHEDEKHVGGWMSVLSKEDYEERYNKVMDNSF